MKKIKNTLHRLFKFLPTKILIDKVGSPNSLNSLNDSDLSDKIESIAKIGGWDLDLKEDKLNWSKGVYDIYNIPESTCLKTLEAINFYVGHDRKKIKKCLEDAISLKKSYDEEFEFIDGKGNKKWVRAIGEPVVNKQGKVVRLQGVFQDVTNKKKAEISLKESKRYLDLAVESSSIGIWDWYLNDNTVEFSKSWADMLGLEIDKIGMNLSTWQVLVHPDDINQCYQQFLDYLHGASDIYENIHRLKHKDGSWRYILSRGKFSDWNSKGKPKRFTGIHLDISDRKKLQDDQNYILANTSIGIWKWNILKDELVWDDSLFALYGIKKSEFRGTCEDWLQTIHEDYKEKTITLLKEAIDNDREFNATFAIKTSNNDVLYIGAKARIERDSTGRAISMSGINWDKTSEYLSELEIKSYVKGLDKYAIITRTDENGNFTHVNERFREVSKYSENELIGSGYSLINSGHHPETFFQEMWSKILRGETWRGEIRNRAKDGSFHWVDTTISPTVDVAGKIVGFMSLSYDITELKNTQLRLTEALSVERMSKIILAISDTPLDLIHKINRIFTELFNDRHFLKVKAALLISSGETDTEELKVFKQKNDNSKTFLRSLSEQLTDSKYSEIENELLPLKNMLKFDLNCECEDVGYLFIELETDFYENSFNSLFLEGIKFPISQLIHISLNKQRYNRQRKIALHNSKLASVGELAAGVGHEINNPLAVIKGYLHNLNKKIELENLDNDYLVKTINKMENASTRIEKIVSGLRNFSRNDNEEFEFFDILSLVNESISMIREIYAKQNINIEIKTNGMSDFYIRVNGNRGRVQQALMNLIANAKDATENQAIRQIFVSLNYQDNNIDIAIRDNGAGIAESVQSKIFDAFFTTKAVNKGTGIGLSLAHSIASEHDGKLNFTTEIGKGTEFKLSLPASNESKVLNKINETNKEESVNNFLDINIMLVEDEENVTDLLDELMAEFTKSVTCFKNGEEAYQEYMKNPDKYDVIVSDIQMPIMNGAELVKKIRHECKDQPRIILMTAGVSVNFEEESSEVNKLIDGYFYKPFRNSDVYKALSRLVDLKVDVA